MDSQPDFIVVDDTSIDQISYSAGWVEETFSENVGGVGPPLYTSLHVATSPASFTFTFNGECLWISLIYCI